MRRVSRRAVLGAGLVLCVRPAGALTEDAATSVVRAAIDDIVALISNGAGPDEAAPALRRIMERRSSLPDLARYCAGPFWAEMTEAERAAYTDAFAFHVSRTYSRQFRSYDAREAEIRRHIRVDGVVDAGRKGRLVKVAITPPNLPPIDMRFLVSDRPGRPVIVDMMVEGISMARTQREIIVAMLEARGGDIGRTIADLRATP